MSIDYTVELVDRPVVRDFIEQHHYSHNINGLMSSYCFAMYDQQQQMVGAMIYGKLGMANAWKKYGNALTRLWSCAGWCWWTIPRKIANLTLLDAL